MYPDTHRCPPRWEIRHEDWLGDETRILYGSDAEAAGEKYAEQHDCYGDYEIVGGQEVEVQIRKAETATEEAGPWETYTLSGEPVPEYRATRKT